MRLFIAVDLEELKGYFVSLQSQIPKNEDAKLTFPKSFHLTLKFLGDVPDNKIEEIKNKLKEIKFGPFEIRIDRISFFTEPYLRVIFLDVLSDEIYALQKQIDDALADSFKKEKEWKAHLTLARVKYVKDKNIYIEKIKKIKTEERAAKISSFKLIKSTLSRQGPIYEDLAVYKAE